jgi:hypothetical protein
MPGMTMLELGFKSDLQLARYAIHRERYTCKNAIMKYHHVGLRMIMVVETDAINAHEKNANEHASDRAMRV